MPFCPKCGYEIDEDDAVCYNCGTIITKKRVDGGLQHLNNSPSSRNMGKIAAIQSKIDGLKKQKKSISTSWKMLLFVCVLGYVASIYYGFNGNFLIIIGSIGTVLGILGEIWTGREIKKGEDKLSRL